MREYFEDNKQYLNPLEPWRKDQIISEKFNPYSVVLVFDNAKERSDFIEFVRSYKNDFLSALGNFKKSKTSALADCPEYMNYLCKSGETLVNLFSEWKKLTGREQ